MSRSSVPPIDGADPYEELFGNASVEEAGSAGVVSATVSRVLNDSDYEGTTIDAGRPADDALNNWWAMLALVLVLGTAAGNILVCLAIAWERRLQNVTNYFLMSLAITDLMVAILVMPLGILTLVRGNHASLCSSRVSGKICYSRIFTPTLTHWSWMKRFGAIRVF
ncbi:hypothetical protein KM043_007833 [Ampulex compressa]|nr:hypothetical protein KM043_007833 [Ampulex compressa]